MLGKTKPRAALAVVVPWGEVGNDLPGGYPRGEEGTIKIDDPQPMNEQNVFLIESTGFQFMQYCFINADRCVYYRSTLSSSRRKLVNPIIGKVARVHGARGKHIAIFCLGVSSFGNRLTTKYNV